MQTLTAKTIDTKSIAKPIKKPKNSLFVVSPKILVVEDNKTLQQVTTLFLKKLGCIVDIAEDGEKALGMFNRQYDLILSDIGLPKISGIEVAKSIRNIEQVFGIKRNILVALTALGSDDQDAWIDAGFNDSCMKPLTPDSLKEILIRWLPHFITPYALLRGIKKI